MKDRSILVTSALMTVGAFFILSFAIDRHALDPDHGKNWWSVEFADPKGSSLDFTVTNHSATTRFFYTVGRDREKLDERTIEISSGSSVTVPMDIRVSDDVRTTITVRTSDTDRKELYK